jgi:hypothetical protein
MKKLIKKICSNENIVLPLQHIIDNIKNNIKMKKNNKYQQKTENGMTIGEVRHLIGKMTTTKTFEKKARKEKKKINHRNYFEFID